jgi:hypothetical protein
MKIKAILCALALTVGSAFGQGLVTFQNSAINAPIRTVTGGVTNNMPAGGHTYSFYFTYGASSGNLNFTSATYFNNDTAAGRIDTNSITANIALQVPGGTPASFQLYAFKTSFGTFAEAQLAPGGEWYQSGIITLTPSISPSPGTTMFGTAVGSQFQGFTFNVNPIPEPSTIALGILGAGSLLFLRRKK